MSEPSLAGCRVLIVEDEYFLADDAARALSEAGASIVGPVATIEDAKRHVEQGGFDAALLDIKLRNEMAYSVADMLRARAIPFAFVTGFDQAHIPERFADVPHQAKPHDPSAFLSLLKGLCAAVQSRM